MNKVFITSWVVEGRPEAFMYKQKVSCLVHKLCVFWRAPTCTPAGNPAVPGTWPPPGVPWPDCPCTMQRIGSSSRRTPLSVQVILLFQNVDGVDLCLYCLYMQASALLSVGGLVSFRTSYGGRIVAPAAH